MQQDKNIRKERLEEENCQGDLQQENCLDSQTKGTIKNIGADWKERENLKNTKEVIKEFKKEYQ